jgi:hypothetical protein
MAASIVPAPVPAASPVSPIKKPPEIDLQARIELVRESYLQGHLPRAEKLLAEIVGHLPEAQSRDPLVWHSIISNPELSARVWCAQALARLRAEMAMHELHPISVQLGLSAALINVHADQLRNKIGRNHLREQGDAQRRRNGHAALDS